MAEKSIEIDGAAYPLHVVGGQDFRELPRQLAQVLRGDYGSTVQVYAQACVDRGLPVRLNWHGVINTLGDFWQVTPPRPYR